MSATRDTDRILRAWLDQMPSEAPDRAIDAVLQATTVAPQVGASPSIARWRPKMTRLSLIASAGVLTVALAGGTMLLIGGRPAPSEVAPTRGSNSTPTASFGASANPPASPGHAVGPWTAVYARSSDDGAAVEIVTLAPDGSQRVVRSFTTRRPGGADLGARGVVSQTGSAFLYSKGLESSGSGSIAVFDLGTPSGTPSLVAMGAPLGPRWSSTGLLAVPGHEPESCTSRGPECWAVVTILDPTTGATRSIGQVSLFGGGPSIVWARDASGIWDAGRIRPTDGGPNVEIRPDLLFMDRRLGAGGMAAGDGRLFAWDGLAMLTVADDASTHVATVRRIERDGTNVDLVRWQLPDGGFQPALGDIDPSDSEFQMFYSTGTAAQPEFHQGPIVHLDGTTTDVPGGMLMGWVPASLAETWPADTQAR